MELTDRFARAAAEAARLHRGQMRKGSGTPYVAHLLAVAALALEHGADEDEAIAALLHDAVEDQGGEATRERIARRFGERAAAIVAGCSDAVDLPKPPWLPRKEAFVARLPGESRSVRLVTACDKLHNARSLMRDLLEHGEAVWSRFHGGREGTLWFYRTVAQVYDGPAGAELPAALLRELREALRALEEAAA